MRPANSDRVEPLAYEPRPPPLPPLWRRVGLLGWLAMPIGGFVAATASYGTFFNLTERWDTPDMPWNVGFGLLLAAAGLAQLIWPIWRAARRT